MGKVLRDFGKLPESLYYTNKAYTIYQHTEGDISIETQDILKLMSELQMRTGDFQSAVKNYQFLLGQHLLKLSPTHIEVFFDHKNLGICLLNLVEYDQAAYHLRQSLSIATLIFSGLDNDDDLEMAGAQERLKAEKDNDQYSAVNLCLGFVEA